MSKQEILERVQDILNQDGNVQALDLLRHDLENDIIEDNDMPGFEGTWKELEEIRLVKEQFNRESG